MESSRFIKPGEVAKIKERLSGETVLNDEILQHMMQMLYNSITLSDRMMTESTIKLIYKFLLKNYDLLYVRNNRRRLKAILKPVGELINNEFLKTMMGWLGGKFDQLPNRTDDPPISEETRKAMEKRAIDIDESLREKHKWQEDNPEKVAEKKEKKEKRVFKINDIVGVKDREHKWNMARVLYVFTDERFPTPWYYVHFHNWHENFREWVGDANKIKPYMPKRDYFRR